MESGMTLIYLDYNCFQRGFDDQRQFRIRMETAACEEIFSRAAAGRISLIWSFMHEDESAVCPFIERKVEVLKLSELCSQLVAPANEIMRKALEIQKGYALESKDSLHLACAISGVAAVFVTCDDAIKTKTRGRIGDMVVISPTEYVTENP